MVFLRSRLQGIKGLLLGFLLACFLLTILYHVKKTTIYAQEEAAFFREVIGSAIPKEFGELKAAALDLKADERAFLCFENDKGVIRYVIYELDPEHGKNCQLAQVWVIPRK